MSTLYLLYCYGLIGVLRGVMSLNLVFSAADSCFHALHLWHKIYVAHTTGNHVALSCNWDTLNEASAMWWQPITITPSPHPSLNTLQHLTIMQQ